MKIEVNEHGTIVLKEVFNPLKLVSENHEKLIIVMRDGGFEICYGQEFYELKNGKVDLLKTDSNNNQKAQSE